MKRRFFCPTIFFVLIFFPATIIVNAQEPSAYRKNAISFNLTKAMVNELNMGFEHFLSIRRSIEFDGGLIYVNEFLKDQADDWQNAAFLSEHGYAARFHYKIYKRKKKTFLNGPITLLLELFLKIYIIMICRLFLE
jgi:hypothetical protein